ncbi:inositol monophosphatase family protein [Roseibium sp. SCP14]|uniref:inositol monophosphatase family protein n=1 Tax=Roseibium sp. SCP14 TaxID=3141375 RepID=UPI0033354E84
MSLSQAQIDRLITVTRDVAQEVVMPRFRSSADVDVKAKKHVFDLVTEADLLCEQRLTQVVPDILPGSTFVGEEGVASDPGLLSHVATADRCVVLDPVDGTWNFASGLPTFGLILSVVEKGIPVFGMLYDILHDSWVAAEAGGGAFLFQPEKEPRKLLLGAQHQNPLSGFYSPFEFPEEAKLPLAELALSFGHVTSLRCACYEYLTLLQGHSDFILSAGVNPWDHLAGLLAVKEAGGRSGLVGRGAYRTDYTQGSLLTVADPERFETLEAKFAAALGQTISAT